MNCILKQEIYKRIECFQKKIVEKNLDGAIVLLNSDMYYFTGTVQNSFLYVPTEGEPVLMIKKSLNRGREESPLKNIVYIKSYKQIAEVLSEFGYGNIKNIGMELDVIPFNIYKNYKHIFMESNIYDVSNIIKEIRAIKSPYEIKIMKRAAMIIDKAFLSVPRFLKEDMTELELAALFEGEMRKNGYSGCCRTRAFNQEFFYGNVCTGNSGFYPSFFDGPVGGAGASLSHPQGPGWKRIKRNEVIYVDYTCIIDGYAADETRIFCIGELNTKMLKAFQDSVFIQSEVVKCMKPGIPSEEPYFMALKLAEEMGYKDNFMGYKEDRVKFLGHGIGLELDEWPVIAKGFKMPITAGMTFALEPKFVFPEGAIGIENSFIMTEKGAEKMSNIPDIITYIN